MLLVISGWFSIVYAQLAMSSTWDTLAHRSNYLSTSTSIICLIVFLWYWIIIYLRENADSVGSFETQTFRGLICYCEPLYIHNHVHWLLFQFRFGMVYYNNLISAALLLPFCVAKGEIIAFYDPSIMTHEFILWNCVAGFLGFFLNFASLWCVSSTSATTYAVVGTSRSIRC